MSVNPAKTIFKSIFFLLALAGGALPVWGQNLVPNPSFETLSVCPSGFGIGGPSVAPPWIAPTAGTFDVLNACATFLNVSVPSNSFGYQEAITGVGYAGAISKIQTSEYREYIQAPLLEPLDAGVWYYVSFYISLGEAYCAIEHLGAYFSVTAPGNPFISHLDLDPQVESFGSFLNDADNWTLISGCFQSAGGEAFITIGNFDSDAETPVDPDCGINSVYYYIEDISVVEGDAPDELFIDLDGPVFACFSYEINPGIPDVKYLWEDGSENPTLIVTESGVYSVTISNGCNLGIDSIEVIINETLPPLSLGPEELTICNGESFTISLEPSFFEYTWQDGSNDAEYTITNAGIYSVTVDNGCSVTSDQITINVLDPPAPFTLGDDSFLCSDNEQIFSFDPGLGDFLWQDGSTSSSYVIEQGGTYALTISNICGAESDEIILTDLELPALDIGPDGFTICEGEIIEIQIDPDLGDILWQDGSSSSSYEITNSGFYSVSVTNQCGTVSDQLDVFVVTPPNVNLGSDTILCEGDSLILTADQEGFYIWQDNSSADSFLVTSTGMYSLSVSNFCGTAFDAINIAYSSSIIPPDLGPDFSLCPGESAILFATSQGASYRWNDNSTADSLLVNTPGTYFVEAYNDCISFVDTIIVSVNANPPQVALPVQLTLCQGQSITLDAAISGVSFVWNDNSQNQQLLVTTPGTYSLTVSNACGSDADTTLIADGGPAPAVTLGNDLSLCAGESITLSPVFSNVDSWLWQDGSTMPSYIVSAAGAVIVEVNNSCGNAFDTLQVALLPDVPPLDLGPDNAICSGESFVLSINTPNVNILWPDGSSANDFLVDNPGFVFASISNSCGISFDTIEVLALPDIPALNLGPDQSLCPGEVITLAPGIPDVIYQWHDGSSSNTYTSTQEETVTLTISNECGDVSDTLQVIESTEGPQVNLGNDIQVCEGETVSILSGISGVNYLWQDGSTNANYSTTQSGVFILTVNNSCGTDADTIAVDISGVPPTPALGPDTTVCENISLLLISTADAITTIQWQDGSSSPSFNVTSSGTYTIAESNRCGDASDTIIVSYLDAPDPFTLGPDTTLCPGETISLISPTTAFDIRWQDGSNQASITADQPITYSLQLSNDCGSVSDDFILSFDTRVPVLDLGPDLLWCQGDVFTLDATQPFLADYLWNTGTSAPMIEINSPGIFSIEVIAPCAIATAQINVEPGTDCSTPEVFDELYIPNVFSPNGDGINDVFILSYGQDLDITSMQGSIYDRWGNLVFSSTDIPFSWNGLFNDELMLPGVYVYAISIYYSYQGALKAKIVHGDVTLVR